MHTLTLTRACTQAHTNTHTYTQTQVTHTHKLPPTHTHPPHTHARTPRVESMYYLAEISGASKEVVWGSWRRPLVVGYSGAEKLSRTGAASAQVII